MWVLIPKEHFLVVRNNLILPSSLFVFSLFLLIGSIVFQNKRKIITIICVFILLITAFDLLRFGWKFNSFSKKDYFFPQAQAISFLQKQKGQFRIATTDSRILPPNFSSIYRIESIDGYDPLYLRRYGELISAMERNKPDISPPFGFNRLVSPHNYESKIMDLLGVRYILSLSEINSPKLTKAFQEGQTVIYENKNALPRAFFVNETKFSNSRNETIKLLFDSTIDLANTGIIEGWDMDYKPSWAVGSANITYYSENKIIIDTENIGTGFLILTDTFYPTWRATIDNNSAKIYTTDYNFRGVLVPIGKHRIEFNNSLF
jgi:hypothetical protein